MPNADNLRRLPQAYSERQRNDAMKFMEKFPMAENLYGFFAPHYWGYALQHLDECTTMPCISLGHVDELYGKSGIAKTIVKTQIVGVYSLTTARDSLNSTTADLAADLFLANYGYQCTLYGMMIFFSKYATDWKETKSSFDVQDVLRQFRAKFLPWWCSRLPNEYPVEDDQPDVPRGQEAKLEVIRRWMESGDDVRKHELYKCGMITDKDIEKAKRDLDAMTF